MIDVRIKQKVQDDRIVQIKKKVRFFKKLIDSKHFFHNHRSNFHKNSRYIRVFHKHIFDFFTKEIKFWLVHVFTVSMNNTEIDIASQAT